MGKDKYLRVEETLLNTEIQSFLNEKSKNGYKIISYNEMPMNNNATKITVLFEKHRIIL